MGISNFLTIPLGDLPNCHEGEGVLRHACIFPDSEFKSALKFLHSTILPPGTTIGSHTHDNDEELYIVLEGNGVYEQDGVKHAARPGCVFLNPPFGTHGLVNDSDADVKLLVFCADVLP